MQKGGFTVPNNSVKYGSARWLLALYDAFLYLCVSLAFTVFFPGVLTRLTMKGVLQQVALGAFCVFGARYFAGVYRQIWRYGGMQAYIRLIFADAVGCAVYIVLLFVLPIERITFMRAVCLVSIDLLAVLTIRIVYQYFYQCVRRSDDAVFEKWILRIFARVDTETVAGRSHKIKIAIVGAGSIGSMLAQELLENRNASYTPVCFIDKSHEKVGREIYGIPVLSESENTERQIKELGVQVVVFAIGNSLDADQKLALYNRYRQTGCKVEVYDFPTMQSPETAKRHLREFDIQELLFRSPVNCLDGKTVEYYKGKTILITGGGGSIGSELCRQIAKMEPKKLVILDVYENGAYDLQQELRILEKGKKAIDVSVEITTVCDKVALERVFAKYRPDIVLHAAAHKHVPFMEHNACEAVKNNVFGTLNVVNTAQEYGCERFIMISTDKAVNPTNVMGATKRMCEMIVLSRAGKGKTQFTATRFGNVLGSAGSVVPLFKRQIAAGGPVTITDKRIIRYFMTIPEASQLVLTSGAMANDGELFVLDMGKPVHILDLAESMIRLCGYEPYKEIHIQEIGLREGEKLYEELLLRNSDTLEKTENSLIFIEKDTLLCEDDIENGLALLKDAVQTGSNDVVREALKTAVPSFVDPEVVNKTVHA